MSEYSVSFIGENAQTLEVGKAQREYSRVVLTVSDEIQYVSGTDSGETLEVECPFGTQEMCDNILESVIGYVYQPYSATGAEMNPASEIGDAVSIKGNYVGLYNADVEYGHLPLSDISAPTREDIDSEFPHESEQDRKINRKFESFSSELKTQANEISAKVSRTGGNDDSTFSWSLDADGFVLASKNGTVMRADKDGMTIFGEIKASSGRIGCTVNSNGEVVGGFIIKENSIYNGMESLSDSENKGIYIGTDGIALGGGAFSVDSNGNMTASNGTFSGNVYAGKIVGGATGGYMNGSYLSDGTIGGGKIKDRDIGSSKITANSLGTGCFVTSVNESLGYANSAHNIMVGTAKATNFKASNASIDKMSFGEGNGKKDCTWIQVVGPDGSTRYAVGRYS